MKKITDIMIGGMLIAAAVVLFPGLCARAAVPSWVTYQGYLTATDGTPLDTTVDITFRIYEDSWGGTPLWDEIHTTTVTQGRFEAILGSADPLSEALFEDGTVWLGVQVGSNSEMTPLIQFTTVPYAFRVGTVDGATGGTVSGKINIGADNTNPGAYSLVAGRDNQAGGDYSAVTGGIENFAGGSYSSVSGGIENYASGSYSNVSGGVQNSASGSSSAIGGGELNSATSLYATIGGGSQNTATGSSATIAGGAGNVASGAQSVVGGGQLNKARGISSVIAGGGSTTQSDSNCASGNYSVIGGGFHNVASNDASTIAGGYYHISSGNSSTVGGGYKNTATNYYSTVGGGTYNGAMGQCATVGGGRYDSTWGNYSTVSGGYQNFASGAYSTIPGGNYNYVSGNYSFAAGRRAQANGSGQFVWADGTNADFIVEADSINSFNARASGGFKLYTNTAASNGVTLWSNDNTWNSVCDSTKKTHIRRVDTRDILDRVSRLPISRWAFKDGNPSIEHIGPMAQDFWNQFRIGADSLSISTVDPAGIALAAIQELQKEIIALRAEVKGLREERAAASGEFTQKR